MSDEVLIHQLSCPVTATVQRQAEGKKPPRVKTCNCVVKEKTKDS